MWLWLLYVRGVGFQWNLFLGFRQIQSEIGEQWSSEFSELDCFESQTK
jgi:hypothetical protein